ncbi:MAG: translation initiation factor IF-2 [Candidatus Campbellbacteria bacterium]|nr:translation initiation factor IF-2 [Candidatus Campbellbacteria bacterium]
MTENTSTTKKERNDLPDRPPVITVMGHIDHGKSQLLDHIRHTNVVEGESGGITQHISAYEVVHESKEHGTKKITFLDTPGHEAFQAVRAHGAQVADIAILVVAADEGVKPQTKEALETIKAAGIPYIVALNKIDRPEASTERTKMSLSEHEIYIEEYGGDVPCVPISAKTGEGLDVLLDMILLVAELEELKGDPEDDPTGVIIESNVDQRKGVSATLIIKNGTIETGNFIVAGDAYAPIRIMEDFVGKKIPQASFSMPVRIVGFNKPPAVGSTFQIVKNKKEAEALVKENVTERKQASTEMATGEKKEIVFPLIIRADVQGCLEAIKHEFNKIESDLVEIKIVSEGVGSISESDVKMVAGNDHSTILGFRTPIDAGVSDVAERMNVEIETFDVIYKLTEWLGEKIKEITPLQEIDEELGQAKILKNFSRSKNKQVLGGKVTEGKLTKGDRIKILRRGENVGRGRILELQSQKIKTNEVHEDSEFGTMLETKEDVSSGDTLVAFKTVEK